MEIYQNIWNEDENKFSVSRRLDSGDFEKPAADILLDKQVKAAGNRGTDLAKNPLFNTVNKNKLQSDINLKFIELLNNYVVNFRPKETYTEKELNEIYVFLETVQHTKVFQLATDYIESELNERIKGQFKEKMFSLWFQFFTNWFKGRSIDFCSGFEHVFVGEGHYRTTNNAGIALGEIGGYHNWIKFLLDEKTGRVNYLGYNYGLSNNEGPDNPHVVTLQMIWELRDLNGDLIAEMFKSKGGFFVGTSPECELAMGTVAYFESRKGMFSDRDKKQVKLCSGYYNLIMFRSINKDGSRGDFIRSFFPEYMGKQEPVSRDLIYDPDMRDLIYDEENDVFIKFHQPVLTRGFGREGLNSVLSSPGWRLRFDNWK